MSVFCWCLIGHLVGDWLLQNDWMATGKRTGLFTWPGLLHFVVYTLSILAVLWLSQAVPKQMAIYISLGLTIFISHWLIDATNIVTIWMRFWGQRNQTMVRVMVDQTLHLLILAGITVIL